MAAQKWHEMSRARKTAIVVVGVVEFTLTTVALVDLIRRPASSVRGSKVVWGLACFVQPFGPVTYLVSGRLPCDPTQKPVEAAKEAQPA